MYPLKVCHNLAWYTTGGITGTALQQTSEMSRDLMEVKTKLSSLPSKILCDTYLAYVYASTSIFIYILYHLHMPYIYIYVYVQTDLYSSIPQTMLETRSLKSTGVPELLPQEGHGLPAERAEPGPGASEGPPC